MATSEFKVGDKVLFGRTHGEQTHGTVIKVNPTSLKVRQDEERGTLRTRPAGTIWTVPPSLCRLVSGSEFKSATPATPAAPQAKRPESEILRDIVGVYAGLSPENLTGDGELSRTEVAIKRARLNARLIHLFREIGRRVSEDEAYRLTASPNAPVGLPLVAPPAFKRPTAKDAGFKKGDKVQFETKGQTVVGFVRQANAKTITVDEIGRADKRYWRVPPAMLRKVA